MINKILWKLKRGIKLSKGETILEVITALFVIIIGSATAANLIITSLRANMYNRDNLIALNLAEEGIEYMRSLRDTNWLKFSYDTQNCWNMMPNVDTCVDASRIKDSKYFALADVIGAESDGDFNLSNGVDGGDTPFLINYYSTDGGDLTRKDFMSSANVGAPPLGYSLAGNSKFFRSIYVSYKTLDPVTGGPGVAATEVSEDMMLVTSEVGWLDSGIVRSVSLNSALTKYK